MKKSFLKSLVGLDLANAKKHCFVNGYNAMEVSEECMAISAIVRGNTVILWHDYNKVVTTATAGDPCEVTE